MASELNLIFLFHHSTPLLSLPFTPFTPFTPLFLLSTHTVEANEGAGAGEGLAAGGPGSGGAGQRLVPGPDPQCHGETAAGRPELPLHGQFNGQQKCILVDMISAKEDKAA